MAHFFYLVPYGIALRLAAAAYHCGNSSILAVSEAVQAQIGELVRSWACSTQHVAGSFVTWLVLGGATPPTRRRSSVEGFL